MMSYMRVTSEIVVTGIAIEDDETRFRLSVKPQSQTLLVTYRIQRWWHCRHSWALAL